MIDPGRNYRHTMTTLQQHLTPAQRAIGRIVHARPVEHIGEALEATVARPSVLLGAVTGGLVFATPLYHYARYYGFALQGSEIWIGLLLGGIIGGLAEAAWSRLHRR